MARSGAAPRPPPPPVGGGGVCAGRRASIGSGCEAWASPRPPLVCCVVAARRRWCSAALTDRPAPLREAWADPPKSLLHHLMVPSGAGSFRANLQGPDLHLNCIPSNPNPNPNPIGSGCEAWASPRPPLVCCVVAARRRWCSAALTDRPAPLREAWADPPKSLLHHLMVPSGAGSFRANLQGPDLHLNCIPSCCKAADRRRDRPWTGRGGGRPVVSDRAVPAGIPHRVSAATFSPPAPWPSQAAAPVGWPCAPRVCWLCACGCRLGARMLTHGSLRRRPAPAPAASRRWRCVRGAARFYRVRL